MGANVLTASMKQKTRRKKGKSINEEGEISSNGHFPDAILSYSSNQFSVSSDSFSMSPALSHS